MLLGLSEIMDSPGQSVSFSVGVDLSDLCYGITYPVSEPVLAQGVVRNTAGVLVMKGSVSTTIHGICDRCASEFSRFLEFPMEVVLSAEPEAEEDADEWIFPLVSDSADLDDIVRTVFVLNLDSKLLCREDCKGLCPRCGKNLNDGSCACKKELDPRWAALEQFIEK